MICSKHDLIDSWCRLIFIAKVAGLNAAEAACTNCIQFCDHQCVDGKRLRLSYAKSGSTVLRLIVTPSCRSDVLVSNALLRHVSLLVNGSINSPAATLYAYQNVPHAWRSRCLPDNPFWTQWVEKDREETEALHIITTAPQLIKGF